MHSVCREQIFDPDNWEDWGEFYTIPPSGAPWHIGWTKIGTWTTR